MPMCFDTRTFAVVSLIAGVLVAASCTPGSGSPQVAYKDAEIEQPLEVPPDLTRNRVEGAAEVPTLDESGERLLPQFRNIELRRAGPNSWLEMQGAQPEEVWPEIEAFLRSQGLTVRNAEPAMGVIETDWVRRYDSPPRSGIAGILDSLFGIGQTDFSDRYQFRLERMRGDAGTRLFVSHWVAEDQARGDGGVQRHRGYEWQHLAGDPAVVAEIQQRLLLYIGLREAEAVRIVAAETGDEAVRYEADYEESNGIGSVFLDTRDWDGAWGRLGDSLGQLGGRIAEQDPDAGLYHVRWVPPDAAHAGSGGIMAVFEDDEAPEPGDFLVQLREDEDESGLRIVVADAEAGLDTAAYGFGGVPSSRTADKALLQQLADHLSGVVLPGTVVAGVEDDGGPREVERDEAESPGTGATGRRGY